MKSALGESGPHVYEFGPFRLIPERRLLFRNDVPVDIGPKAFDLLLILVEHAGHVVSKQELMDRLWLETFVEENNLAQAASSLRRALADDSDLPRYVKTVPRHGYIFVHPVQEAREGGLGGSKGIATSAVASLLLSVTTPELSPVEKLPDSRDGRSPRSLWSPRSVALVAVVVVFVGALLLLFTHSLFRLTGVSTRSTLGAPPGWEFLSTGEMAGPLILSPDGASAVFGARNAKSESMLFLRSIDSLTAEQLAGTENAAMPFWSPDGSKIGFFADQKLKTLDFRNRSVQVICDVKEEPRGGTWEGPLKILFADSTRGPILMVSAGGGIPTPVTNLAQSHFTTHRWPESLPDGKHFLFLAANHDQGNAPKASIFLGTLDGQQPRFLFESDSNALFVAGQLLFVSGGKLLAQPFNPSTGRVGTAARILADTVEYDRGAWHAAFVATPQLLVYRQRPKGPETQTITFLDDSGKAVGIASRTGNFESASVSPDGKTIAALCDNLVHNICLIHPDGTLTQVSENPINYYPVWSPDGSSLAYGTHRGERRFGLVMKDLKAQSPEQVLMESGVSVDAASWSPNQKELLIERVRADNHSELAVFRFADRNCRNFLASRSNVAAGKFSPDGKWVAYQSDESGNDQVYIASYPNPERRYVVSGSGGQAPRWGPSGRGLYFLDSSDMIYHVRIEVVATGLKIGEPQPLFRPTILPHPLDSVSFDVTGKEPLFVVDGNTSKNDSEYILVTSWTQ